MAKSDYADLRKNIKFFEDINEKLWDASVGMMPFSINQFQYLERALDVFERFPDIASLKEVKKIRKAIETAKKPGPFFNRDKNMKSAAEIIYPLSQILIREANNVAQSIKPPKDLSKKGAMIQLIKKYRDIKSKLNDDLEVYGFDDTENIVDLWFRYYKKYQADLFGILNEFNSQDSDIEFEEEFLNARRKLDDESIYEEDEDMDEESEEYIALVKIRNLIDSCNDINALAEKIKADYSIKEDEIEKPREILELEQKLLEKEKELEFAKNQIKTLLNYIFSSDEQKPRRQTAEFREIDVYEIERLIGELSDTISFATKVDEKGKMYLRLPKEPIERIYNALREELKHSQYLDLYDETVFILKNIPVYGDDLSDLRNVILNYINRVKMVLDSYHRGIMRKKALRRDI